MKAKVRKKCCFVRMANYCCLTNKTFYRNVLGGQQRI